MIEAHKIINFLGGKKFFSRSVHSELDFFDQIKKGLPPQALTYLIKQHFLTRQEVVRLIISDRTLARRMQEKHLSAEESDRLVRIARITSYAEQVMGSMEKAQQWLRRSNHALENRIPLDFLITESGARLVETVLARIEQGIYS